MPAFIYLASQSPRRQELLRQLGVRFELLLPSDDEDAESLELRHGNEAPKTYVQRVCRLKAQAALQRLQARALVNGLSNVGLSNAGLPNAPVLCADTTVALGRDILGKPANADEAREILQHLSGTTHRVFTAVTVAQGSRFENALSESRVTFAVWTPEQIDAYINSGEPFGKAGAYGIQGSAAQFAQKISGSYTGIMGLPLYETACLLRSFRVPFL